MKKLYTEKDLIKMKELGIELGKKLGYQEACEDFKKRLQNIKVYV